MAVPPSVADPEAFAERLRVQVQARYPACRVERDTGRYGLRVSGPGVDRRLSLVALQHACRRQPERTAGLIADYVRATEAAAQPPPPRAVDLGHLVWCVRTERYIGEHRRDRDLLLRPVTGSLVAFAAERLPGSTMRGVPREEWAMHGDARAGAAADENTASLFAQLAARIGATERVPRDGWRLSGDQLFQGSVLVVPAVLCALAERAGGDVLLAVPDRSVVLAIPAAAEAVEDFGRRARRTFREALHPCSPEVLRSDGRGVEPAAGGTGPRSGLLRRLLG